MEHVATLEAMYGRINTHDVDGFCEYLADDFVEHETAPGLAHEHWGLFDALAMMQQLGAIPALTPA